MYVFEAVRDVLTTRQVAESYGLHVKHNGMCCCPFHGEKNPSMKVDKRFHCFACGKDGDVIDFAASIFLFPEGMLQRSWLMISVSVMISGIRSRKSNGIRIN